MTINLNLNDTARTVFVGNISREAFADILANDGEIDVEPIAEPAWGEPLTVEYVTRKLAANKWKETAFTCPDGAEALVSPCSYAAEVRDAKDCDYFLLYWDMPWGGNDKLDKVVEEMNNHAKLLAEQEEEKTRLREYFEAGEADNWTRHDWSWYSDWHKDVYGYRPHGHVCGVYVRPY